MRWWFVPPSKGGDVGDAGSGEGFNPGKSVMNMMNK